MDQSPEGPVTATEASAVAYPPSRPLMRLLGFITAIMLVQVQVSPLQMFPYPKAPTHDLLLGYSMERGSRGHFGAAAALYRAEDRIALPAYC